MNVEALKQKHSIFREVRNFFDRQNFTEIHTPLLVKNPGLEPHLIPFETYFEPGLGGGKSQRFFLPTSPEYHLKKSLAQGFDCVYEISKSFRNSELSARHEPEFFMLEWYRNPGLYTDIAKDFENLLGILGSKFSKEAPCWIKPQHLTVQQAFLNYAGVDIKSALCGGISLRDQCIKIGFASVNATDDFDTCFDKLLVEKVEPKLGFEGPLFLWDYPAHQCALSRIKAAEPLFCERFEVYWRGLELANAFGELTDPEEQRKRCLEDLAKRRALYPHKEPPPLDEDLFRALAKLKTPVGGIAVGLERLIQCLLGLNRLQDVIAFPHSGSDI